MLSRLKKGLLINSAIFNINAKIKSFKIKKQYKRILEYYRATKTCETFDQLMENKGFTHKWSESFTTKKLNVFYLGTDEYQDNSGFIQTLSDFSILDCFYQSNGQYGHAKEFTAKSKQEYSARLEELIRGSKIKYDILMMQSWGSTICVNTLLKLKKEFGFKIINISMDDRHTFWVNNQKTNGVAELLPAIDLALTTAPEAIDWYHKEGIPAVFFPEASDSTIFSPINTDKKYDVGFVGAKYGIREQMVNALLQKGVNVKAFGNGWESGRLPLEKTNEFYNQCRIVLGVGTIGYCNDFFSLKLRDFDVPMSGGCYITNNNPDLKLLYDIDKEIMVFSDANDLCAKVCNLLNDSERLDQMARLGFEKAKSFHTYTERFSSLFNLLGVKDLHS